MLLTAGKNLGVARGRNQLLEAALEWGADLVVSLDDDLLVPSDYIANLSAWVAGQLAVGIRIGVVAPVVIDFHALTKHTMAPEAVDLAERGELSHFPTTDELRAQLRSTWPDDIPVEAIITLGSETGATTTLIHGVGRRGFSLSIGTPAAIRSNSDPGRR